MHKLAVVIPTKDRPEELRRMLTSVRAQTRRPHQIIVVDGSMPDVRAVVDAFPELAIDYVRVFPPSLSQQRNAGMRELEPDITIAGYLDDDLVLEPDAIENMLRFWESAAPEFGGAAFMITNAPAPRWLAAKSLFGIDGPVPGRMLRSGFPSSFGRPAHNVECDWLYGGATVWRREIIARYHYDEWFLGTGFMEDVDFSFSVREHYRLIVVAQARVAHYSAPTRPDRERLLGTWQVVNRMYFVRKHTHRGLSIGSAWVANIGLALLNGAIAFTRLNRSYWRRAQGNVAGIIAELRGRREQIAGHLK